MKKILFLFILTLNLIPAIRDEGFSLFTNGCHAQNFSEEIDPNDICDRTDAPQLALTIGCTQVYHNYTTTFQCSTLEVIGTSSYDSYVQIAGCEPNQYPGDYYDCANVLNGTAHMEVCGCVGGTTGLPDDCIPDDPTLPADCNGVPGGSAYEGDCGCIGGNTGIYECPITEDTDCTATVNLTSINSTVLPNETLNISGAIISAGNASFTEKTLQVSYNHGEWYDCNETLVENGTSISVEGIRVKVLGNIAYRIKGVYKCNSEESKIVYSNEVTTESQYCKVNFSADYASRMNTAWANTVAQSIQNPGTKYEYGFDVTFKGGSGTFEVHEASASAPCEQLQFGVELNTEPVGTVYADLGASFTIGNFHTHPPLTYCDSNISLDPGPSSIDTSFTYGYPRLVRTYSSKVSGGHSINESTMDYVTNGVTCTTY